MTFGEKLIVGGTIVTIGAVTGGTGLVGGGGLLATGLGAGGGGIVATGVNAGGDYYAEGDPQDLKKIISELSEENKSIFMDLKYGKDGKKEFSDQEALDALFGKENAASQYYVESQLASEKALEEAEAQTEATEDVKKAIEEQGAGGSFAQSKEGQRIGYGGGTSAEALTNLGKDYKADGKTQAQVEAILETSGFSASQKSQILGGMNDGFLFFSGGTVTGVPIASQDDASIAVGRKGGPFDQMGGGPTGGNTFNFHGGSTAEIIAHFENLQAQGII